MNDVSLSLSLSLFLSLPPSLIVLLVWTFKFLNPHKFLTPKPQIPNFQCIFELAPEVVGLQEREGDSHDDVGCGASFIHSMRAALAP